MRTENRFDPVFDCQQVFKALMNALAQPGKVFSIEENVKRLGGNGAPFKAVALTLLDNWRSFYVDGAPALAEELRELTYGVPAPLEEADYLFFPRMGEPGPVIEKAKPGTLPEPHKRLPDGRRDLLPHRSRCGGGGHRHPARSLSGLAGRAAGTGV